MNTETLSSYGGAEFLLNEIMAPKLELRDVRTRVKEVYGLEGLWDDLGGEREQNFRLTTSSSEQFVVKIAPATESRSVLLFQCEALSHIQKVDCGLGVPKILPTLLGDTLSSVINNSGQSYPLRLLSYLRGETIFNRMRSRGFALDVQELDTIGQAHGRLARALQGFMHQSSSRPMPWDLANGLALEPWMKDFLPAILNAQANEILGRFSTETLPNMRRLRSQVIYNDFHESNVLGCEPNSGC